MERSLAVSRPAAGSPRVPTANDRLKRSFGSRLWTSLIMATALHFAVLSLWPTLSVAETAGAGAPLEHIEIPPELDIPEAPPEVRRPARPEIGSPDVDPDITMHDVTWAANPPDILPPPPERAESRTGFTPPFTPFTVAPRLENGDAVRRTLEREYPAMLRDAGIGGTVTVLLYIDDQGVVQDSRVREGSGYEAMDRAALAVARTMRFSPALNRDQRVAVWVEQAVTFSVR